MGRVDRYFRRRFGGTEDVVVEQPPVASTPESRLDTSDLTPTELRLLGRDIQMKQRAVSFVEQDISKVRSQISQRQKAGLPTGGAEARLAKLEASRDSRQNSFSSFANNLSDETYQAAITAAPRRFKSGARQGSSAAENANIRAEQSRSFFSARELAQQSPGIYEYRSGGAFISTAQDGVYQNQRGQIVQVRSPIGQRTDRSLIYGEKYTPRTVTGIPFTKENIEAIRSSSSRYASAGALFAAAQAPTERNFTPAPSKPYNPRTASLGAAFVESLRGAQRGSVSGSYSVLKEYALQSRNPLISQLTGVPRATRTAGSGVEIVGANINQNQLNTPLMRYLGGWVEGAGGAAREDPLLFNAEIGATYLTGGASGFVYASAERKVASSVLKTRLLKGGVFAGGTTLLAHDLGTSSPQEFGSRLPSYVAFGKGFKTGYRSVNPSVQFLGFSDRRGVGAFESPTSRYTMTGSSTNTYLANIKVNGRPQQVPFRLDSMISGRRTPGVTRTFSNGLSASTRASRYFSVDVAQYGTFSAAGRDYYAPGRSFIGAFSRRGGLFVAKSGDTVFVSEALRRRTPLGKELGRFAILEGSMPAVRSTGLEVRSSTNIPYQKNRFGFGRMNSEFGDIEYAGFLSQQQRSFSYGGVASRSRSAGGASQSFLNRAFGFGERTGVLPATRVEPRPYRPSFDERFFPKRNARLYSMSFPVPSSQSVRPISVGRTKNIFYPGTGGRSVTNPFTNALPFIPETTRFGGRSPIVAGRLPSRGFGVVPGITTQRVPQYARYPVNDLLPAVKVGSVSRVDPLYGTSTIFRPLTRTTPVNSSPFPGIVVPGTPGTPGPSRPGLPFPGVGGPIFGGYAAGRTAGRKYRYSPDLYSTFFGVRAKGRKARSLQRQSFTGLEIRPVV